jgi:hypothetical protein
MLKDASIHAEVLAEAQEELLVEAPLEILEEDSIRAKRMKS